MIDILSTSTIMKMDMHLGIIKHYRLHFLIL